MDRKSSQLISKKQKSEVAQLKRANRKRLLKIGIPLIALLSIISLFQSPQSNRRESFGTVKIRELDENGIRYLEWLKARGTSSEVILFNNVSQLLHDAAVEVESAADRNKAVQFYLSLLQGVQRVAFLAIAGMRLWFVLLICGIVYGFRGIKAYSGPDLLGTTGNGRLFYSGILADLSELTEDGTPSKLVPGLACPRSKTPQEVLSSPFGAVLKQHGALNTTTTSLSGIILAYGDLPAYVGQSDDSQVQNTFAGATLAEGALSVLKEALTVHAEIISGIPLQNRKQTETPQHEAGQKLTLHEHIELFNVGMKRVLPETFIHAMRTIDPPTIAALVLGLEAGKVLGTGREGNRWVKKSQYPQLCARAVVHSIPAFSSEYPFEVRKIIRQAFIYSSRFSVFGPVRLPTELSLETRALRQWAELLLALPHELNAVVNEVEFYGYASELHASWQKHFFEGIVSLNPSVVEDAISSDTGLLFMPVTKVVDLVRTIATPQALQRLEELVKTVSQLQRIHSMSLDLNVDPAQGEGIKGPLPQHQRIFTPLSLQEVKTLSEFNHVPIEIVKEWSTIRNVFNTYGWLARQVGSSSISDHSCVATVCKGIEQTLGGNAHGLLGKRGMVPFRGSIIEQKLGKFWKTRFLQANAVAIADDNSSFDKLMSGVDLHDDDEVTVGIS